MRTLDQWLDEYGDSHRNRVNKALHWICVPPIVLSVIGFLWALPFPAALAQFAPWLNWATIATPLALLYYVTLSPALALGLLPVFIAMLTLISALERLPWPLWLSCVAIFVVAWLGQFIGHAIEGKRPSFFKDVQFLLIGPLWLLADVYRRLGWRRDALRTPAYAAPPSAAASARTRPPA
jgi:uncharacterized membrane protein YGL010W